jgi:hypothetical protein
MVPWDPGRCDLRVPAVGRVGEDSPKPHIKCNERLSGLIGIS